MNLLMIINFMSNYLNGYHIGKHEDKDKDKDKDKHTISEIWDETLENTVQANKSANRSRVLVESAKRICENTLEELHKQDKQIENCDKNNEELQNNLNKSGRKVDSINSIWGTLANKIKPSKKSSGININTNVSKERKKKKNKKK